KPSLLGSGMMEVKDMNFGDAMALVTESQFAQRFREYLQRERILDSCHRMQKLPDGTVALPVLRERLTQAHLWQLRDSMPPGRICALTRIQNPIPSKAAQFRSPTQQLRIELQHLVSGQGASWSEELERDLPCSWQRHGDLVLLSEDSFRAALWRKMEPALWETVACALGAQRLGKRGCISPDGMRSPKVTLLLGQDSWVEHVDNGVRYTFDVTRCMFCPGNITEKLRVASLPCTGEVVVDLYAGIGYFTLPYLMHADASFVHACEWNPHAVEALRRTLELNGVQDRCRIHQGDNRQLELKDVADRVNLGLIPSSEAGWPIACRVLRSDMGGVLHIHQNVESFPAKLLQLPQESEQHESEQSVSKGQEDRLAQMFPKNPEDCDAMGSQREIPTAAVIRSQWQRWAETVDTQIRTLLQELHGKSWRTKILHIEPVKSYTPHVHQVVLDLECRPFP
uniref:tRNA wybutosine-synthesizing protein 2 homolog n=1 Tax=Sphenodon punctatus TaxID=8508 RepID=A0A8D0GLJ8_SPHPU